MVKLVFLLLQLNEEIEQCQFKKKKAELTNNLNNALKEAVLFHFGIMTNHPSCFEKENSTNGVQGGGLAQWK